MEERIFVYAVSTTMAFAAGVFGTHYLNWNPFAITAGWIIGTIIMSFLSS